MPDGEFECAAVLMEHTQDVKAVAWHPREDVRCALARAHHLRPRLTRARQILASASYDDTIQLYSDDGGADDWASIASLAGHASTVWSVAFAPAGAHLASASADCTLRLWARGAGAGGRWAAAGVVHAHERTAYSVAWAATPRPDGGENSEGSTAIGWLASTGADGRINVYAVSVRSRRPQTHTRALTHTQEPPGGPPVLALLARIEGAHGVHDVNALAWCPLAGGAGVLASAGDDGCVRVWEVR
jgi:WD40 repeat protein